MAKPCVVREAQAVRLLGRLRQRRRCRGKMLLGLEHLVNLGEGGVIPPLLIGDRLEQVALQGRHECVGQPRLRIGDLAVCGRPGGLQDGLLVEGRERIRDPAVEEQLARLGDKEFKA